MYEPSAASIYSDPPTIHSIAGEDEVTAKLPKFSFNPGSSDKPLKGSMNLIIEESKLRRLPEGEGTDEDLYERGGAVYVWRYQQRV